MNLTEQYVIENGYDYFGNAAEDTLVFFVRDEDAPYVEPATSNTTNTGINLSKDTVNAETGAETYQSSKRGKSTNFDFSSENEPADEASAIPDANTYDDEFSQPMPSLAQKDEKQTGSSTFR